MEKPLPYNIDAEKAVLGGCLINGHALKELLQELPSFAPEDFHRISHQVIFRAMHHLHQAQVAFDYVSVLEYLERKGLLEDAGGADEINALLNQVPTTTHLLYYARIVVGTSLRRQLIEAATDTAGAAYGSQHPTEILLTLMKRLSTLEEQYRPPEQRSQGISARDLQRKKIDPGKWAIEGILPEGLSILAAKPKSGKSRMALGIALAIALGGRALGKIPVEQGEVLYLALEDNELTLQQHMDEMLEEEEAPEALTLYTEWPKLDKGGLVQLERWVAEHPRARLIIIDTFFKVRPTARRNANAYDSDYDAVSLLHKLALRSRVPILMLHHVRKALSEDPFEDISGSFGFTAPADTLMVLRRQPEQNVLHLTGRTIEQQELALILEKGTGRWILTGKADEYMKTKERTEILRALCEAAPEPLSAMEVTVRVNKPYNNVRHLLWSMQRVGNVRMIDKKYTCPHDHSQEKPDNSNNTGNTTHNDNNDNSTSGVIADSTVITVTDVIAYQAYCPKCGAPETHTTEADCLAYFTRQLEE